LRAVIERKGWFCALYSDRARHFFETPQAGGPVSRERLTQVGRALKELGIEMIPAYSPQARGRSERRFGTWQGRLPQELRLAGIATLEEANRFLRQHYIGEMNRKFSVPAAQPGNAFVPVRGQDLDRIFSLQHERVVAKDNTVRLGDRTWQIERTPWRGSLAGGLSTRQAREWLPGLSADRPPPPDPTNSVNVFTPKATMDTKIQAHTSCLPRSAGFLVGTWEGTQTCKRRRFALGRGVR
jgi:hypothetical protein